MQHPKSDTGGPDGMVQMVSTRDLSGRHGPLRASQWASIKGCSRLHARRLERAASDAQADAHADAHADASARGRGPFLVFIHHSVNPDWATSTASGDAIPVSCPLLEQAGWFCAMTPRAPTCHSLRHAALGTALCPLVEGAVALAALVSLAFLNAPPWADSASRTTDMPASRLLSTGFRGLK